MSDSWTSSKLSGFLKVLHNRRWHGRSRCLINVPVLPRARSSSCACWRMKCGETKWLVIYNAICQRNIYSMSLNQACFAQRTTLFGKQQQQQHHQPAQDARRSSDLQQFLWMARSSRQRTLGFAIIRAYYVWFLLIALQKIGCPTTASCGSCSVIGLPCEYAHHSANMELCPLELGLNLLESDYYVMKSGICLWQISIDIIARGSVLAAAKCAAPHKLLNPNDTHTHTLSIVRVAYGSLFE